jgi:hypothetical protein
LTFSVAKGDDVGRVNGNSEFYFQTGTTAGDLILDLKLGFQTFKTTFPLAASAPRVDSLQVIRTATGFDAVLEGFDNTRTLTHATFTFYDASGKVTGSGPMRFNLADTFARWWGQSTIGGAFLMRASFPVAGDAGLVTGLTVDLESSKGQTAAPRVAF